MRNSTIPKANKKPLLLLAKRRESVRKRAKKKARKKPPITNGDSGAKKNKTTSQTSQKNMAKTKVGKKFLIRRGKSALRATRMRNESWGILTCLLIDFIVANSMI
jgi:hypothetical protein